MPIHPEDKSAPLPFHRGGGRQTPCQMKAQNTLDIKSDGSRENQASLRFFVFSRTAAFGVHLPPNDFYFKLVSVGPFQEDDSC